MGRRRGLRADDFAAQRSSLGPLSLFLLDLTEIDVRDDLIATLRRMIVNDLYVEIAEEQIGLDDGLQTIVGLDSIGFVELRVLCEQRFNVQISDDDYTPENFSSLRRVANLVDRLQSGRSATVQGV